MPQSRAVTLPAVMFPCLCIVLRSHKMGPTSRAPPYDSLGPIWNLDVVLPKV